MLNITKQLKTMAFVLSIQCYTPHNMYLGGGGGKGEQYLIFSRYQKDINEQQEIHHTFEFLFFCI